MFLGCECDAFGDRWFRHLGAARSTRRLLQPQTGGRMHRYTGSFQFFTSSESGNHDFPGRQAQPERLQG